MTLLLDISETTFIDQFPLLPNHLNANASFDWGCGFGTLFETYGSEWDFIRSLPINYVWTLVDSDCGLFVVSGRAFVNRLGYFASKIAVPDSVSLEVTLEQV